MIFIINNILSIILSSFPISRQNRYNLKYALYNSKIHIVIGHKKYTSWLMSWGQILDVGAISAIAWAVYTGNSECDIYCL